MTTRETRRLRGGNTMESIWIEETLLKAQMAAIKEQLVALKIAKKIILRQERSEAKKKKRK